MKQLRVLYIDSANVAYHMCEVYAVDKQSNSFLVYYSDSFHWIPIDSCKLL